MPETRLERVVFVLGILAIAALGFLVARLWHHTHAVAAPSPTTAHPAPARTTAGTHEPRSTAATTSHSTTRARTTTAATTRPATTKATAPGRVSLLLTANTDTWVEIRAGSSTGPVLYSGTLSAASSKSFRARALWARFGAAGNLSARFDGKSIRLPSGTYDATFDGRGFRRVGA